MDVIDELPVRFHFGGTFFSDGKKMQYCGGTEALSYIDRDKISLPELVGHLRDHCTVSEGSLLHWLFPGKEMENGLRVLVDDKVCQYMADSIVEGGVADIFVEAVAAEKGAGDMNGSASEDDCVVVQPKEMTHIAPGESSAEIHKQVEHVQQFYLTPSEKRKEVIADKEETTNNDDGSEESDDSEDGNYMPGDSSSSEQDDEAFEILRKFKAFKRRLKSGQVATLDDVEQNFF
ncbi:unnamed protein product [Urochloa humidicola]